MSEAKYMISDKIMRHGKVPDLYEVTVFNGDKQKHLGIFPAHIEDHHIYLFHKDV